jgi:hypothetical protein
MLEEDNDMNKILLIFLLLLIPYAGFSISPYIPESAIIIGSENADYKTIKSALEDPEVKSGSVLYLTESVYTEQDLVIDKDLIIMGRGYQSTIIQAAEKHGIALSRVIEVTPNTNVTLKDLCIRNGNAVDCPRTGGGIYNLGNLLIDSCKITQNASSSGGGITQKKGSLTILNSIVSNNTAHGKSEITASRGSGGGIKGAEGIIIITNSIITGNKSNFRGGGLKLGCRCTLNLEDSSVADNRAILNGGGIHIKGEAVILNSTISGNKSNLTGGILNSGFLTISDTVIKNNTAKEPYGCAGLLNGSEGTIVSISNCSIDSMDGVDPLLIIK